MTRCTELGRDTVADGGPSSHGCSASSRVFDLAEPIQAQRPARAILIPGEHQRPLQIHDGEAYQHDEDWLADVLATTRQPTIAAVPGLDQEAAAVAGRSVSVRRGAAGASLEFLDYVLRLALLLDKPEVWVLLDHHFHLVCDVPRRDREAIRF